MIKSHGSKILNPTRQEPTREQTPI